MAISMKCARARRLHIHCRSPDLWLGVGHPKPNKYKTHKSGKAEREERSGVAQVIRYGSASRITECGPKPTGQTGHAHSQIEATAASRNVSNRQGQHHADH